VRRFPVFFALVAFAATAAPAAAQEYDLDACKRSMAFERVSAAPTDRGFSFVYRRVGTAPVRVELYRQATGRRIFPERFVAAFKDGKGEFGRLGDGHYNVLFTTRAPDGTIDERRVALPRENGRFLTRPAFEFRGCGLVERFNLGKPVFGGSSGAPLGVSFRLGRAATVEVEVRRNGRVVHTAKAARYTAGRTYRMRFSARGRSAGDYDVVLRAGAGKRRRAITLTARRL
jgi:hypothetical protein